MVLTLEEPRSVRWCPLFEDRPRTRKSKNRKKDIASSWDEGVDNSDAMCSEGEPDHEPWGTVRTRARLF